jgi:hypothetical protein
MLLFRASLAVLLSGALIGTLSAVPAHASSIRHHAAKASLHHARKTTHRFTRTMHRSTRRVHHYVKTARHYTRTARRYTRTAYHARFRHYYGRPVYGQTIAPQRVMQIQEALIRVHYLTGKPNGMWDAQTIAAMKKYQADHGWQTRLTPDSRALEKLGLGPNYSDALNAKDLTLASPVTGAPIPTYQLAGFAAASGISQ